MTLAVGPTAAALRHIEHLVSEHQLGPGDKLPTERELAAEAGVSRAVVRSVLEDLEHRGIVVRHVGRGTFSPRVNPRLRKRRTIPAPARS